MVHHCNSDGDTIFDANTGEVLRHSFVLDIEYDEENSKTIITLSEPIEDETKIGFSSAVSEKHDATNATYSFDSDGLISFDLQYELQPELFIQLKELIDFAIYKNVALNPSVTGIYGNVYGAGSTEGQTPDAVIAKAKGYMLTMFGEALSNARLDFGQL